MGKFIFRRIGGRIVPIIARGGAGVKLSAETAQTIKDIQAARTLAKTITAPKSGPVRALMQHEARWTKLTGKKIGADVAKALRKLRKK